MCLCLFHFIPPSDAVCREAQELLISRLMEGKTTNWELAKRCAEQIRSPDYTTRHFHAAWSKDVEGMVSHKWFLCEMAASKHHQRSPTTLGWSSHPQTLLCIEIPRPLWQGRHHTCLSRTSAVLPRDGRGFGHIQISCLIALGLP